MDAVVVASHLPGEGHFRSDTFRVDPVLCEDDYSYWRGLAKHWDGPNTICNVEHDIEVHDEHIAALLDCPHPLCSWAYRCHWISTGIPDGVIAAGAGARDIPRPLDEYYLQGGEEWAEWSAIGLVKIAPAARIGPLRREPWSTLELAVEDAVKRPWHTHGNEPGGAGLALHHHW